MDGSSEGAAFVLHCDVDAFFVQVEQLKDPSLQASTTRLQPLAVVVAIVVSAALRPGGGPRHLSQQAPACGLGISCAQGKAVAIQQHQDIIAANAAAKAAGVTKHMVPAEASWMGGADGAYSVLQRLACKLAAAHSDLAHLLPLSIPVHCRRGACCALWAAGWRTCTVRRAGACRTSHTVRPPLA